MRFSLLFFLALLLGIAAPIRGQVPDPGMAVQQDPGMAQDAEAAREKLLKAAVQLDLIETNSEANRVDIENLKAAVARLKADNDGLKQQLAAMQAALDKAEADRARERQALLDEVAALIAKANGAPRHHEVADNDDAKTPAPAGEVHTPKDDTGDLASDEPAPHHATAGDAPATTDDPPAPRHHTQKGYYHVVADGETLSMICAAYRDSGVKVTVAQVRRANGLTSHSVLKVGQKIFIPKPGD